jgi:hypothetical protein
VIGRFTTHCCPSHYRRADVGCSLNGKNQPFDQVIKGGSTTELLIVVPILATEALSAGATPVKRLG